MTSGPDVRGAPAQAGGAFGPMPPDAFDQVSVLAADVARAPLALVCELTDGGTSWRGVGGPAAATGPDTLGVGAAAVDALARRVAGADGTVVVPDTAAGPDPSPAEAVAEWVGVPVRAGSDAVVAALVVVDTVARPWGPHEVALLERLSASIALEWRLRAELAAAAGRSEARISALTAQSDQARSEAADTREWARRSVEAADARATRALELADGARRQASVAADLAETLQQSLAPMHPPRVPGVEIAARHRSPADGRVGSGEVLGDFYDVFATPTGWGVVVGDVCGHGAKAARTTALARSTVRALGHSEGDPAVVLSALNGVLYEWFGAERSFVSVTYAVITAVDDGDDPTVHVASAGHPPAFVLRGSASPRVEELDGGGRVLGIVGEAQIAEQTFSLGRADALVLYTDGVTEARPPTSDVQFGEEGVRAALDGVGPAAGADGVAEAVIGASGTFAGGRNEDDALVLVVRRPA